METKSKIETNIESDVINSEIQLPEIQISFKKLFPSASDKFISYKIRYNAGIFYDIDNITVLSYGEFTKSLLKKYNRTIEKQVCNTISHEIIHWWLLNELNYKVCLQFDNIAEKLFDYGVY